MKKSTKPMNALGRTDREVTFEPLQTDDEPHVQQVGQETMQ